MKLVSVLRKVRLAWLDFCTSTGIKGFSFIVRSDGLPEQLLWGALIIVCAALTVWDVQHTIEIFVEEPTMTKTDVRNNETIHLGSPSLCIDLEVEQLKYGKLNLYDVDEVKRFLENMSFISDMESYLISSLHGIKKYRRKSVNIASKIPQFHSFDPLSIQLDSSGYISSEDFITFLSLIVSTFSAIVRFEHLVEPDLTASKLSWGLMRSNITTAYEDFYIDHKTSPSIFEVYKFITKRSSNLVPVWQTTGALQCEIMNMEIISKGRDRTNGLIVAQSYDPCIADLVSWMGTSPFSEKEMEFLCINFNLNESALLFENPEQNIYLYLNTSNVYNDNGNRAPSIRLDLTGSPVSTVDSQEFVHVPFGEQIEVHINIQGEYEEINTLTDPCANKSKLICRLMCKAEYSLSNCGCQPLSVQHLQSKFEIQPSISCSYDGRDGEMHINTTRSVESLSACYKTLNYYDPSEDSCVKKCRKQCASRIYSVKQSKPKTPINLPNATLTTLYVDLFLYPYVYEVYQMDSRQFMSTLGGNLNFWLGASFLVLVHAFVFFIRVPFEIAFTKIVRHPFILSHNHQSQLVLVRSGSESKTTAQESNSTKVESNLDMEERLIRRLLESDQLTEKILKIAAGRKSTVSTQSSNRWADHRY